MSSLALVTFDIASSLNSIVSRKCWINSREEWGDTVCCRPLQLHRPCPAESRGVQQTWEEYVIKVRDAEATDRKAVATCECWAWRKMKAERDGWYKKDGETSVWGTQWLAMESAVRKRRAIRNEHKGRLGFHFYPEFLINGKLCKREHAFKTPNGSLTQPSLSVLRSISFSKNTLLCCFISLTAVVHHTIWQPFSQAWSRAGYNFLVICNWVGKSPSPGGE